MSLKFGTLLSVARLVRHQHDERDAVPVLELHLDCVGPLDEDVGDERRRPVLARAGTRAVVHGGQDLVRLRVLSQPRVGRGQRRLPVGRDRGAEGVELPVLAEQLLGPGSTRLRRPSRSSCAEADAVSRQEVMTGDLGTPAAGRSAPGILALPHGRAKARCPRRSGELVDRVQLAVEWAEEASHRVSAAGRAQAGLAQAGPERCGGRRRRRSQRSFEPPATAPQRVCLHVGLLAGACQDDDSDPSEYGLSD